MFKTTLAVSLSLITSTLAQAAITAPPFRAGEKLTYVLKWKKTVTAGRLTTEVTSLNLQTGQAEFKATARSGGLVESFYPIRYTITSSMDLNKMASTGFSLIGTEKNESKRQVEKYSYSARKGTMDFLVEKKEKNGSVTRKGSKHPSEYALNDYVNDTLSLLYYVRAAKLPTSAGEVKVPVIYEAEKWTVGIRFVGETSTKVNGVRYPAYQYQMVNISETGETNAATTLTIAQDSAKTLTYVESEVEVGKIQLKLKGASGSEEDEE